jgi:hypothetical protein
MVPTTVASLVSMHCNDLDFGWKAIDSISPIDESDGGDLFDS